MKGIARRKQSLHGKIAATVLVKLFISGNERCHSTDSCSIGCLVHETDEQGNLTVRSCSDFNLECLYTGSTDAHNDSWVAANVCDGLVFII